MSISQESIDLFLGQFDDSVELQDLAAALLSPGDEIETVLDDLLLNRWVNTATGIQLDRIGEMVGAFRRGRTDTAYRTFIKSIIYLNVSRANPEAVIEVTRSLSSGSFVRYWENYPAGFQVFTDGPNTLDISGSVLQNFSIVLDDEGPLALDDTGGYNVRFGDQPPEGLAMFLKSTAPAGVDHVAVTFSLGINPLFGFGSDFITAQLTLDTTAAFILDDGGILDVYSSEVSPSLDGFEGFGELNLIEYATDDTGQLAMNSDSGVFPLHIFNNNQVATGGGKLAEGIVERQ